MVTMDRWLRWHRVGCLLSVCPEAAWEEIPSPRAGSGGTIYGERETLEMQVRALVEK
jgi:hypothetical protein